MTAKGQHFLLSTAARTLSLAKVVRLTDDQAFDLFRSIRWADTDGDAVCGKCGGCECYTFKARRIFKCKACGSQFSVQRDHLRQPENGSPRHPGRHRHLRERRQGPQRAPALPRSGLPIKTAFVLSHKIREALAAEQAASVIEREVEVDGAYFGGYVKPANGRVDRKDWRRKIHQSGKRQVVVVARERDGETLTHIAKAEADGVPFVLGIVQLGATVHADEASHWDNLEARFLTRRINHSVEYSTPECNTNMAESFFSRLRRAEVGTHHHIAGPYLGMRRRWRRGKTTAGYPMASNS